MKDFITGITALIVLCVLVMVGYQYTPSKAQAYKNDSEAILTTLNSETKAFFNRDYAEWQTYWVHEAYVYKSYMIMTDSSMSETLGWQDIAAFGRTYIQQHPTPEELPVPLNDIELKLYGSGAWVSFKQQDPARGLKRETRLMEKINGQWKIAGMHTTIYGF